MRRLAVRLLHSLLLLIGVSILSFLFSEVAPGDILSELELDPHISAESLQQARARLGLDRPLLARYLVWLESVVRGDLGYSVLREGPVGPALWRPVRNTLLLAGTATLVAWLIALPIGVWSASRRGGWLDRLARGGTSVLLAVPDLLLGLAALYLASRVRGLPTGGMAAAGASELSGLGRLLDLLRHLLLPATALVLGSLPILWRHVRAALVDVLDSSYLLQARGHGVSDRRVLFVHALRAAANPLVSLFGLSIAGLLSGSLLIEEIMGWPGLGPLLLDAIRARDVHLVIGAVLLSSLLLIVGNLIADLLLYWIDPRVRE